MWQLVYSFIMIVSSAAMMGCGGQKTPAPEKNPHAPDAIALARQTMLTRGWRDAVLISAAQSGNGNWTIKMESRPADPAGFAYLEFAGDGSILKIVDRIYVQERAYEAARQNGREFNLTDIIFKKGRISSHQIPDAQEIVIETEDRWFAFEDRWFAFVDFLPRMPGAHLTVILSADGDKEQIIPGA